MAAHQSILYYFAAGEGHSDGIHRAVAQARATGASLTILRVVVPAAGMLSRLRGANLDASGADWDQAEAELAALRESLADAGVPLRTLVRQGRPGEVILRQVEAGTYTLVMKRAAGDDGRLLGSTARLLMRQCPTTVWVVKPGERPQHVVAAVDPEGEPALQRRIVLRARDLARQTGSYLTLVSAWDLPAASLYQTRLHPDDVEPLLVEAERDARRRLDDLLADTPGALPVEERVHLRGPHGPALLTFLSQRSPDALVLGSRSRGSVARRLLGHTAERVLTDVDCSVVVLRPQQTTATQPTRAHQDALAES